MRTVTLYEDQAVRVKVLHEFSTPVGVRDVYSLLSEAVEDQIYPIEMFSETLIHNMVELFFRAGMTIESLSLKRITAKGDGLALDRLVKPGVYFFLYNPASIRIKKVFDPIQVNPGDILSVLSIKGNQVKAPVRGYAPQNASHYLFLAQKMNAPVINVPVVNVVPDSSLQPIPNANVFVKQNRSGQDVALALQSPDGNFRYYAVYDGHGGRNLPENHMARVLSEGYKELRPLHFYLKKIIDDCSGEPNSCTNKIIQVFIDYDTTAKILGVTEGSTATILIVNVVQGRKLAYIINVGDSRTILYTKESIPIFATQDHNPQDSIEAARLEKLRPLTDGLIQFRGRIRGVLAVSRAFGDFDLKMEEYKTGTKFDNTDGALIVRPDVWFLEITEPTNAILSSDGIFESKISDHTLVEEVRSRPSLAIVYDVYKYQTSDDVALISTQV